MQLRDYFDKIQSDKLSDAQKNALYGRILSKTQYDKPLFSRTRFYAKVAWYAAFLWILGLSIYIPFLGQNTNTPNGTPVAGTVSAWYIAKVVNVEWSFHIESDGNKIDGNNINDGDTVILAKDSSLVVQVGDRVEGKISWPASFIVRRSGAWYAITLKEGDYIEFATVWDQPGSPEVALISETHKFTARTQAGKAFHFVLTEENAKPLLVNKSNDDIQITNESSPDKTTLLAEHKSMVVGTYILAATATVSDVATLVATKIQPSESVANNNDYDDSFFRGMLLADNNTASNNAAPMAMMAAKGSADTSSYEPTYDAKAVRANLIPQFVWVDIKYVTYYYLNGQEQEYHVAYENFLKRMYELYDALKLEIPAAGVMPTQKDAYSLDKLRILAEHIQANIPSTIPQHQVKTLATLVTFLQKLSGQSFGAYKWQDLTLETMFQKIQ